MKRFISVATIVMFAVIQFAFPLSIASAQSPQPSQPEQEISRLYIPTSDHTVLVKNNDETTLVVQDYLSSTRVELTDSPQSHSYLAYGGSTELDQSQDRQDALTDKAFTGHRLLPQTPVYHAGARMYNPTLGMFVQADRAEGPNRYSYSLNNPVSFSDPTGNLTCTWCKRATAGMYPDDQYQGQEGGIIKNAIGRANSATGVGAILDMAGKAADFAIGMNSDHPNWGNNPISEAGQYLNSYNTYVSPEQAVMDDQMMGVGAVMSGGGRGLTVMDNAMTQLANMLSDIGSSIKRGFGLSRRINIAGIEMPLVTSRKYQSRVQPLGFNTMMDDGLGRFYNNIQLSLQYRRRDQSRVNFVHDYIVKNVRYDKPYERAFFENFRNTPVPIGRFSDHGVGVCLEMACLGHLGLDSVGKRSYMVDASSKVPGQPGHAWVMFEDTTTNQWMVMDPSANRLAPLEGRVRDIYFGQFTDHMAHDLSRKGQARHPY